MDYIRVCTTMMLCAVVVAGEMLVAGPARADECRSESEVLRAASAVERDLKKTIGRKPAPEAKAAVRRGSKPSRRRSARAARSRRGRRSPKTASVPGGSPGVVVAKATRALQKTAQKEATEPARQVAWADFFDAVTVFSKDKGRCKVSKKETERLARILGSMTRLPEVPIFEIVAVEQLLNYAIYPTKESWDSYLGKGSQNT